MLDEQPNTWHAIETETAFDGIKDAAGLDDETRAWVSRLTDEYDSHVSHNEKLKKYYEGTNKVKDYGVTADIPNDQRCHWAAKAVDALADRIRLESLVTENGDQDALDAMARRNNLVSNYNRHLPAKLRYGCMAAAVTKSDDGNSRVRFHSAETFTAIPSPDFTDGVVAAGLVIARREITTWSNGKMVPTVVNVHLPSNIGEFRQVDAGRWTYEPGDNREKLPTLYVFSHDGTGTLNPFGRTRITRFVRNLVDDAIRCMWHMQVSGAFYSMAKLYMTGLTDEQFDAIMEKKTEHQLSRILALTGSEGEPHPNVGQLSGNSPEPFIAELRALACQLSGATGVPLNSLGIVQDNPSSAEAIGASREDICLIAERDIEADKATIERVCRAALAIDANATTDDLAEVDIKAKFASPMLNSLAARADWAVKVASLREGFGKTRVAARMLGLDDATLAELEIDERQIAAREAIFGEMKRDGEESKAQQGEATDDANAGGGNEPVTGKQLNGAQTQSLIAIMSQFSEGQITEGQAVNLIATSIGISKQKARDLLNGKVD